MAVAAADRRKDNRDGEAKAAQALPEVRRQVHGVPLF
jgi:hypothetical protein